MSFCRPKGAGLGRTLLFTLALAALAACAKEKLPSLVQPSFYRNLTEPGATLDGEAAASMLSDYRRNNGLPAVTVDPALMTIAEQQARSMVTRDRVSAGGSLTTRLRKAGYRSKTAAENVSAGYYTLAEAFSGWRDSPPHRQNMLLKGATRIGIAAIYSPNSKYKVFWSLILAEPADEPRG
jgi:uncharacterized protein YkwD